LKLRIKRILIVRVRQSRSREAERQRSREAEKQRSREAEKQSRNSGGEPEQQQADDHDGLLARPLHESLCQFGVQACR
jgi:hypothetical protein